MLVAATGYTDLIEKRHNAHNARVRLYNTTKTVPSRGLQAGYYQFDPNTSLSSEDWYTGSAVTAALTGVTEFNTVMGFDWGQGSPPAISQVDNYGGVWDGYFYARYTGTYRFYFSSGPQCGTRFKFDGSLKTVYTDPDGATGNTWQGGALQSTTKECYVDVTCTAGNWYAIRIEFYTGFNLAGASNAYFSVRYKEPSGVSSTYGDFGETLDVAYESDDEIKVLSCGVMNYTNSFEVPTTLTGITGIRTDRSFGQVGQTEFDVLLSPVGNIDTSQTSTGSVTDVYLDSTVGFPDAGIVVLGSNRLSYSSKTDSKIVLDSAFDVIGSGESIVSVADTPYAYDDAANAFGAIKPYRLVHIESGLDDGSGNVHYIDNAWGVIASNPTVRKNVDGTTVLTVTVNDFSIYLNDYCRNYPDNASYNLAGYHDANRTNRQPNGLTRPVCYDGWKLSEAMRDLLMKGNVDPVWTYARKKLFNGTDFNDTYGDYTVRGEDVFLDKRRVYGNPENVDENSADEEYLWFFGYGERLLEAIYSICQNFGYGFGFGADGLLRFKGIDLPKNSIYMRDYATTGDTTSACYIAPADEADWVKTLSLNSMRGAYYKTTQTDNTVRFNVVGRYAQIIMPRATDMDSVEFSLDGSPVTSLYFDGETKTGVAGVFDLSYGKSWELYNGYDASVGYNPCIIFIDLLTYDEHYIDISLPAAGTTLYVNGAFVYDVMSEFPAADYTTSDVGSLSDTINIEDMRNEVVVIGTLLGQFQDNVGNIVNPNNPITKHVTSSAVDVYSLYDPTVKNYLGRRVPFEIYNPAIFNQERANFLATSVLDKYRRMQHAPDFSLTKPDPRIEILDTITVSDDSTRLTTSSMPLWVVGYREEMTVNGHKIDVKLTGHKPLFSYQERTDVTASDYSSEPAINIAFKMEGKRVAGSDGAYVSDTIMQVTGSPDWETNQWAGRLLYIKGQSPEYKWLIVSNTSNTITVHSDSDYALPTGTDKVWSISFDPFDSDRGKPFEIHYDQAFGGKVKVDVMRGNFLVSRANLAKEEEYESFGQGKVVYWDGIDQQNSDNLAIKEDPLHVRIRIETAPNVFYTVSTSRDNSTSEEAYCIPKIMNAGLNIKTQFVGENEDATPIWVGSCEYQGTSGSYHYFEDMSNPAWTGVSTGQTMVIFFNTPLGITAPSVVHTVKEQIPVTDIDVVNNYLFADEQYVHFSNYLNAGMKFAYMIIDESYTHAENHNLFKTSDNGFTGLKLRITPETFYAKLDSAKSPVRERTEGSVPNSLTEGKRAGNYKNFLNQLNNVTVHYEGTDYSPDWATGITSVAGWTSVQRPLPYAGWTPTGDVTIAGLAGGSQDVDIEEHMPVLYWNKYYPTELMSSHLTMWYNGCRPYSDPVTASRWTGFRDSLKNSAAYKPYDIFQDARYGLFPLHAAWGKTDGETDTPPVGDSIMDYAHHNYYAPANASPAPYGRLSVKLQVIKASGPTNSFGDIPYYLSFGAGGDGVKASDFATISELDTGFINLTNYDIELSPQQVRFTIDGEDDVQLVSWTDFFNQIEDGGLDDDEAGTVIFRLQIEVRDRAGRLPIGCRPGKIKTNPNSSFEYANQPIEVYGIWEPETTESATPAKIAWQLDGIHTRFVRSSGEFTGSLGLEFIRGYTI